MSGRLKVGDRVLAKTGLASVLGRVVELRRSGAADIVLVRPESGAPSRWVKLRRCKKVAQ